MKRWARVLIAVTLAASAVHVAMGQVREEEQALRRRIEARYDVVPLTDGIALRPKTPRGNVRLIEISETIMVNGDVVTGRELRERVGSDADVILRLSYLDGAARRALFAPQPEQPLRPEAERETPAPPAAPAAPAESAPPAEPAPAAEPARVARQRIRGDRLRIMGDVRVPEDEEIAGQAVAVFGDVRVDGAVRDQVVAVLGSVDLGPQAVVDGDVVTVGGRLRRAEGARVRGSITEVSLGDAGAWVRVSPWMYGPGPIHVFGFRPVTRLIGSAMRFALLLLLSSLAFVVARRSVEGSAERVAGNPVKATLAGLVAWILFVPVLVLTVLVLAISIVGIPLLLFVPFAVVLLVLMALVGFSGTAYAVGQATRRRLGFAAVPSFGDVWLGVLVILSPLLLGRIIALFGWPLTPVVLLLIATGLGIEFVAWASGFGAILENTFARWKARRAGA